MCLGSERTDSHFHGKLQAEKGFPRSIRPAVLDEDDFRRAFENLEEAWVICELLHDDAGKAHDYRYLAVNPAFERRTGLTAGQAIGKTRRELFTTAPVKIDWYELAVRTGQPAQYEHYSAATRRHTAVHVTSLGGRRFAVLSSDMEERTRAAATLAAGAMRYHNLAELIPAMIWVAVPDGLSFDRNTRWQEYTGQTPEQAGGEGWLDIVHPDDLQRVCEQWALSVRTGAPYVEDVRLHRASDRSYRWHKVQAVLRKDEQGHAIGWFGTCADIEDLKRNKAALRESERQLRLTNERFETMLRHSAIALFMYDRELRCTWSHSPNLGFNAEQSLGRRNIELFERAEDAMRLDAMMQAVIDSGISRREDILIHAAGVDRYFDVLIEPLRDAEGHIEGVTGTSVDITERKQAEVALRSSELQLRAASECFQTALQHSGVALFNQDRELRYTWIYNPTLDLQDGRYLGKRDREIFERAADAEVTESIKQAVIDSGNCRRLEVTIHENGLPRHFNMLVEPLRDAAGKIHGVTCAAIDITERRQAEAALKASEERLRLSLEAGHMATWDWDVVHGTNSWNDELFHLLGYEPGSVPANYDTWIRRLVPEDVPRTATLWREGLKSGDFHAEYRIAGEEKAVRWLEARGRTERDAEGRARRSYGVVLDITERKQLETTLRETDRQKDEFLATLGHELRNPLGAISNAIEILRRTGKDPARLAWSCDLLARQSGQMTRLVDDLLDISRINHGKIELNMKAVAIGQVITVALETCRSTIETRRQVLSVNVPAEPLLVRGDVARLAQVLCNLLTNAAKYTDEEGHIRLDVQGSEGEVVLRVSDNGRGLPAEALAHLFNLFYQVDRTLDRSDGGLGIGLTLVKRLIDLHGGSVQACSAGTGQGSEFVIRLPRLANPPSITEAE